MNSPDDRELTLLAEARAFLEPSRADEQRVMARLSPILGLSGVMTPSGAEQQVSGWWLRVRRLSRSRAAWAVSCALIGAGGGYVAGYGAGRLRVAEWATMPSAEVRPASTNQPASSLATQPIETVDDRPAPVTAAGHEPSLHTPPTSLLQISRAPASAPVTSESNASRNNAIAEELALLKRAERALRSRNGLLALGLLRELDRRFPRGKLAEEREAARVMATCLDVDFEAARRLGEAYVRRPESQVYQARVRNLCGLDGAASNEIAAPTEKASEASGD